ncbi:hypothetical protein [Ensifer sp. BR816]|uniref:hypothetical protein n=1 Tax=Rhizobium sp. (strain BR816) TaxID=1057002 RepID=UPI00037A82F2|nr:hypothetical protein [Ensifer sp. BR816]
MSATRTSSVSIGVSTSTGDAGDETYSEASYVSETTVFVGDLLNVDGGGLGVGVQADATAVGTDTLAQLEVTATVSDGTYVDSASASVRAVAAAQSPDDLAYAAAAALVEVYGGADVYYGGTRSITYTVQDETGSTTVSEVSASVHALQFSAGGGAGSQQPVPEYVPETQPPQEEPPPYPGPECGCGEPDLGYVIEIDGNLAAFDIEANAFGPNTLADVSADAFVVEDQISTVTAVVVAAIA